MGGVNRQTVGRRTEAGGGQQPKFLNQLREQPRVRPDSLRTEDACVDWVRRFILFQGKRHPKELGAPEVQAFLSHLAVGGWKAS